jgi:prepilin-type N-terminal cleavage/methylation domain-containing protein
MEAANVPSGDVAAMKITPRNAAPQGFTLLEIIIVVTIVGLLATIAVSNFIVARDSGRLNTIRHNLREIEAAKEEWAFDKRKKDGSEVGDIDVLSDYFRGGCVRQVVQETYIPNPIGTPPEAALPADVKLGPYGLGAVIPAP